MAADAQISRTPELVCAVLTADCLPVFFCDRSGTKVGVSHAGWKGLAAGILQSTVAALQAEPGQLMAWLGPAIGGAVYEVGEPVYAAFAGNSTDVSPAFTVHGAAGGGRWLLDLALAARLMLREMGLRHVFGGGFCTYSDSERFYSHRRDGITGRMAHLIWLKQV